MMEMDSLSTFNLTITISPLSVRPYAIFQYLPKVHFRCCNSNNIITNVNREEEIQKMC